MAKQWSSFLRVVAVIFLSLADMMTMLGGLGTACVAFGAEKFGPNMAPLIPVKPVLQVLVIVSIAAAVYGIWTIFHLMKGRKGAYYQALIFLVVSGAASAVQYYYSATLRGRTAPNNMRLYITIAALLVLLVMRLPGIWQKTGFGLPAAGGRPGAAGGLALILAGVVAMTTPLWAAPTHTIGGWNTATALLWPLLLIGGALALAGGFLLSPVKIFHRAVLIKPQAAVDREPHL